MFNTTVTIAFSVTLWAFFAYRLIGALVRRQVGMVDYFPAWVIYIAAYTVISLSIPPLPGLVDALFGGLPVSGLLRNVLMLLTAQHYYNGYRNLGLPETALDRMFRLVNPVMIVISVTLFAWHALARTVSPTAIEMFLIVVRNVPLSIWVAGVFMPKVVYLFRMERMRPLRLHRALNIVFLAAFLVNCVSGAAAGLYVLGLLPGAAWSVPVNLYSLLACVVLAFALLLPFRWLLPLSYPRQLYLLIRLSRLLAFMRVHTRSTLRLYVKPVDYRRRAAIEIGIYQRVVAVLDVHRQMSDLGEGVADAIETVAVDQQLPYDDVVRRLSAIGVKSVR